MRHDLSQLVAESLDAPLALLPHLPALFDGLEDLGARADDIVSLLGRVGLPRDASVLDLGCGKGACAIAIARQFAARVRGIDAMSEFIRHATARARREHLPHPCEFVTGDVRDAVLHERNHDAVLMLALGDLLGPQPETLHQLATCARPGGYVIVDDAFRADAAPPQIRAALPDRETSIRLIERAGFEVVDYHLSDTDEMHGWLQDAAATIFSRAEALAGQLPHLAPLLHEFALRQAEETQQLSEAVLGVIWVVRRAGRSAISER